MSVAIFLASLPCWAIACANRSACYGAAPKGTGPSQPYTWDEGNRISIYYGCYGVDPSLDPLADAEEAYTAIVNPDGG